MHNLNAVLLAAEMEPRLFDLDFQLLADSLLTIIAVFVLFIALSYLGRTRSARWTVCAHVARLPNERDVED